MRTPDDFLLVIGIVWFVCGLAAAVAGPERYSGRLFFLTFVFMGPLGIAAALIMKAIVDNAPMAPQVQGQASALATRHHQQQ
jgi:hypothetical protein